MPQARAATKSKKKAPPPPPKSAASGKKVAAKPDAGNGQGKVADYVLLRVDIDHLIPHARNPRLHSDAQVDKLAALMREFGWTAPILIDGEKGIIAGHGRVMAARKLLNSGIKRLRNLDDLTRLPCVDGSHLSEAQRLAYQIADNRIAQEATWDHAVLSANIEELTGVDYDLSLTALSEEELKATASSWQSNSNPQEQHGSEETSVSATIKVTVGRDVRDEAKRLIEEALKEAEVTYEFG